MNFDDIDFEGAFDEVELGPVLPERAREVYESTLTNHSHLDREKHHDLLVAYSNAVYRHEMASKEVSTLDSLMMTGSRNTQILVPVVRAQRDAAEDIRKLSLALKLNPAEPEVKKEAELDELEKLRLRKQALQTKVAN